MKKLFLLSVLMLLPLLADAVVINDIYHVVINGIYYNLIENAGQAEVTSKPGNYSGSIVIPETIVYEGKNYSVTSIGSNAFYGCIGLTSVTIPNSVTSIGSNAFYGCIGLTSVTIPNSVTSIGYEAFRNCSGLTSLFIGNSVTSIGSGAFFKCSGLTSVTIPNSVTSIGNSAFYNCSGLTSVTIGNSVTSISDYAFYNCSGLTSVTIGNSVTSISDYAFYKCSGLTSVTIPNSVTSIGYGAFEYCSGLTSVTIPNSVTSIGYGAFEYCSGLASVLIGSGVTSIGNDAFYNTNLKKIIWLTNTPPSGSNYVSGAVNYVSNDQYSISNKVVYPFLSSYFDVDGIRYVPVSPSEKTCDAIDCVYNEGAENTKISGTAIYKGVTMTVKNIQPYLAYNNKYIKTLTIDHDGELVNYAFANCSNLTSVQLSEKTTAIGTNVFQGCSSLSSVTALDSNSSLNGLYISKAINSIGDYAFDGCSELKNIIMSDSEEELKLGSNGKNPLFASCLLDSVYIGRKISYNTSSNYGYSPFYRNTSLRAVKITDKETEISANEFYGCTNLQRVIIGDGVTAIGDWAFSGCSSLKYFAFGTQVQTIGKEAFSDCAAVVEIISKASVAPTCGAQALDDINKWNCKLYVPDGCLAAYQSADQWKDFFFLEEGQGTIGQGEEQNKGKCEAPTICLKDGKLLFESKTNGVIFHYSITHSDVKNDITNGEVPLTNTYIISAYASKEGYEDSDVVNAQIEVKGGGNGDVNGDGVVDAADVVKVTNIIMGK